MKLSHFNHQMPSELERRQKLFVRAFPETEGAETSTPEHYLWKFQKKTGHRVPSYEYVAFEEPTHEMVGYYAAIPYRYQAFGQSRTAGMVCDVMTDPAHQGKGIFTKIGRFATDDLKAQGLDWSTGFPIRPAVIPGHLKVGWKQLFDLPVWVRVTGVRTLPVLRKLPQFLTASLSALVSGFWFFLEWSRRPLAFDIGVTSSIDHLGPQFESFLEKWSVQQSISLQKDLEFLKWRLGAPGTSYLIVMVRKNAELCAVLILRVVDLKDVRTLAILDWMELESYLIPRQVFSKIFRKLASEHCADLVAMMSNPGLAWKRRLFHSGFIRTPMKFVFILKDLSAALSSDRLSDESNWHLTWIDSDDL